MDPEVTKASAGSEPRELVHEATGMRLILHTEAAASGGELLEMEGVYPPNSAEPPQHFHPSQEERFEVLKGSFHVTLDGEERTYSAGESFVVPPGASHTMRNESDEEGRLHWEVRPALRTQELFETMYGAGQEGAPPLDFAKFLRDFHDEFRLS